MKYVRILSAAIVLITTLVLFAGCGAVTSGSGNLVTNDFNNTGFTMIEANVGFSLEIVQSEEFSLSVTTDDNIAEFIDIEQADETLKISLERAGSFSNITLRAKIEMPAIAGINLDSGASATITGFDSDDDFSVTLTAGSSLRGDIRTGDIGFGISAGSRVELTGSANDLLARSSGGSQMLMADFTVNNADINIDAGGTATLTVNGKLDSTLTGGSSLRYNGDPERGEVSVSGGSVLEKITP